MTPPAQPTTGPTTYYPPDLLKHMAGDKIREVVNVHLAEYRDRQPRPSWLSQHHGVLATGLAAVLLFGQWVGTHALHELQAPDRKRAAAELHGVRSDIRIIATLALESQRTNRENFSDIAQAQGITLEKPSKELELAEAAARKLRNR